MAFVASAVASAAPLWQGQQQFERAVRLNNELHNRGIQSVNSHHRDEQALEFALHKRGQALDRELHYAEMSHASDIARREAVRDVWSQKNQLVQTLMIVDTLMFSCAAAVFCEGDLSQEAPRSLARAYAAILGVSMSLLVVSVWLSMRLQARMAQYDMHRPRQLYICGRAHRNFNSYFACHCRGLEAGSFVLFVVGTVACVAAGAVYLCAAMYWALDVPAAAWTFAGMSGLGAVVAIAGLLPTAAGSPDGAEVDVGGLEAAQVEQEAFEQRAADAHEGGGAGQQDEHVAPPNPEAMVAANADAADAAAPIQPGGQDAR